MSSIFGSAVCAPQCQNSRSVVSSVILISTDCRAWGHRKRDTRGMCVCIGVSGWLADDGDSPSRSRPRHATPPPSNRRPNCVLLLRIAHT